MWLDVKSVKGRKEWKDEEIKGEAIRPFGQREEKKWSPKVWGLMQSWRTVWVRASKREEKNRESERKYTMNKRAVSEKKESSFLLKLYF